MNFPEGTRWTLQSIERRAYYHWQHFLYYLLIPLPFILYGYGYVFTNIRDAIFLTAIVCVLYEIYCLRCDVQYWGELLWRSKSASE